MDRSTSRPPEVVQERAVAHRDAHVVAARDELAHDVRADQAGPAGDEGQGHRPGTLGSAHGRRRRRHRHHALPAAGAARRGRRARGQPVRQRGRPGRARGGSLDFAAFYDRLRTAAELPTTSQPSIGDFLAVFEPLLEAGHDIVSIHISGAISGTVEAAPPGGRGAVAERTRGGAWRSSTPLGLRRPGRVVLAPPPSAGAGRDVDAVAGRARATSRAAESRFSVDTLEFLRRGGRIGGAQAWLGGALKIKPILTFVDGEITPVERVRTQRRAFERMAEFLTDFQVAGATSWMVQHIQAPDQAEALVGRGREIFGHRPAVRLGDRPRHRDARRPRPPRRLRPGAGAPRALAGPARRRPAAGARGRTAHDVSGRAPGVVRSIAGQPMSRSRSSRSARAPPRRPKRRLARRSQTATATFRTRVATFSGESLCVSS